VYGLLLADYAVRFLMHEAGAPGRHRTRIGWLTHALPGCSKTVCRTRRSRPRSGAEGVSPVAAEWAAGIRSCRHGATPEPRVVRGKVINGR